MELKGIDVSAWQGRIDWKTVVDYGMDFAILRITESGNVIDKYFERNYTECQKYNIPTGVYKYSYAMTIAEIQSEARKVVSALNGRELQYPVWLDARSSEGTTDTKDNSGNEIRTQPWYLYSHGWTHRLRFTGNGIDFTALTTDTDKPAVKPTTPTGGKYMFEPKTVKAGDKNTSVLLLQEILRARGFKGKTGKALKLTRKADANTIYALKAYQESRKEVLAVDGVCGPATWKDLIAI